MNERNDLTKGNVVSRLMLYFLPVAAGTLFQQLYNAADAFVVGKFVGTGALAAVGGTPAVVSNLIIGFLVALSGGAAVIIAQLYGAKDEERLSRAVYTSYLFCIVTGIVIGALVIWASPWILRVLKTPEDTYAQALSYQRIFFLGTLFQMTFNMGASILRAVGDSRYPFLTLLVSCGLNIALDFAFVLGFHMGVEGAAYATVIAQAVSSVMVTVKLCTQTGCFRLRFSRSLFHRELLGDMMRIGIPSGIQSSMYGISNMILQIGVNSLGTVVVASWAMSGKIDGVFWAVSGAFGTAITNFVGQNYGARNFDRVHQSIRKGILLFMGMTAVISSGILLLAQPLLHLFSDDAQVISTTWHILWFFVPFYLLWSVIEHYSGVLRGVGDVFIPSIILAVCVCLFRVVWILFVFKPIKTLECLCLCYPVSWVVAASAIFLYAKTKSRLTKLSEGTKPPRI